VRPPLRDRSQFQVPELTIERRDDGQLWAAASGRAKPVSVRRCFPWSEPARYVSLRDDERNEFALIPDVRALEPNSRRALEDALAEAGFVMEVERIDKIDEEVEIRVWKVTTRQGTRSFQTRLDDWPREVPGGGYVIRDVAGDLYYIDSPRPWTHEAVNCSGRSWSRIVPSRASCPGRTVGAVRGGSRGPLPCDRRPTTDSRAPRCRDAAGLSLFWRLSRLVE